MCDIQKKQLYYILQQLRLPLTNESFSDTCEKITREIFGSSSILTKQIKILKFITCGSEGCIFRASIDNQVCAIKVIFEHNRRKFIDEVNQAIRMQRYGIGIQIIRPRFLSPETPYFINPRTNICAYFMEFVNTTFREMSIHDLPDMNAFIHKLAFIFVVLYDNNTCHGDMHGENIVIMPNSDVKLIDFGFTPSYYKKGYYFLRDITIFINFILKYDRDKISLVYKLLNYINFTLFPDTYYPHFFMIMQNFFEVNILRYYKYSFNFIISAYNEKYTESTNRKLGINKKQIVLHEDTLGYDSLFSKYIQRTYPALPTSVHTLDMFLSNTFFNANYHVCIKPFLQFIVKHLPKSKKSNSILDIDVYVSDTALIDTATVHTSTDVHMYQEYINTKLQVTTNSEELNNVLFFFYDQLFLLDNFN
jgi:tRNA A-37 threonylcarbamoyl transferase component Bud32